MSKIVVLGAGPAGLACALELSKADQSLIVIEKDEQVGGLAKTYRFGDFRTDNGPHRFFSKNPYLYDMIETLLGEQWILVNRFTRFYIQGKFYMYPIQFKNVITTVNPLKGIHMLLGMIWAKVRYAFLTPKNFEEFVVKTFGRPLGNFNMLNYTEKIWGLPCNEISVDWAYQRIRGLSISALINKIFSRKGGPKTLVDQFYYPDEGTGLIYERIAEKIVKDGNTLKLNTYPTKIEVKNSRIISITLNTGETITDFDYVVSSIPITDLLNILSPVPKKKVINAAKNLKFRSQVYLFITIDKPSISKDQWIYFPDKNIPFGRISEMKNFSAKMAPADKTSLFVEFFCWENDEIWNMKKEDLLELTMEFFEDKLHFFKRSEIINVYHIRKRNTYPVYTLDYNDHLTIIKNYLDQIENLIYIGRPGRFRYTNQDHSIEMGILAARSILEGKKYDLDKVGSEQEYFESGNIKEKRNS